MKKFLKTLGTTLSIGLFFISTLSGIFLFFHIQSSWFHAMHVWLSMVLLIPITIHIWRNWASFANYFKKKTNYIPLLLSLIASLAFVYPNLTGKQSAGDPFRASIIAIQNGTISQIAPLFNLSVEELETRLVDQGYVINDETMRLSDIAKASNKPLGPSIVISILKE